MRTQSLHKMCIYCTVIWASYKTLTSNKSSFLAHLEGIKHKTKVILTYEEMYKRLKDNQI